MYIPKRLIPVLGLASDMGFPCLHPYEIETLKLGLKRGAVLARDGKITVTLLDRPLVITEGWIAIGSALYSAEEYARYFSKDLKEVC